MSVNGVTGAGSIDSYSTRAAASKPKEQTKEAAVPAADKGAVYEPSSKPVDKSKQTYKPDTALIAKLKADADANAANLADMVRKMMSKQGASYGQANDMWRFLAGGNFTVDAAAKAKAQADTADDGYWGVNKTSERIVDFAKALTGGDPSKIEKMRSAFEKGFKQATGAWGKDLPSISQKTYSSVMDKFDQWAEEAKNKTEDTTTSTI